MIVALFLCLFVCLSFLPSYAHAQEGTDFGIADVEQDIQLGGFDFPLVVTKIIRALLGFLALVMVVMTLYAGYQIMVSGGNEEKVLQGKNTLKNAVIGLAIIFFALIIVQFVINLLKGATGYESKKSTTPIINTFEGAGSLVKLIKDHYPASNQTDIYRNTKIAVTFNVEVDPSSIIENTNNTCWPLDGTDSVKILGVVDADDYGSNCKKHDITGEILEYYGDCFEGVCDSMKTEAVNIYRFEVDENGEEVQVDSSGEETDLFVEADGMVSYNYDDETDGHEAYTFVFKPKELLGNDEADQWHKVIITGAVTKMQKNANDESVSIFEGYYKDDYPWNFETNTEIDLSPPYVVDVSPNPGDEVSKNKALKITFNEAVDPMVVQGVIGGNSTFDNILVGILDADGNSLDLSGDGGTVEEIIIETSIVESLQYKGLIPNTPQIMTDMIMIEDFIYVADIDKTIKKIDISDIDNDNVVNEGTWFTAPNKIEAMHYDDKFLYVVYGGNAGVQGVLEIVSLETGNTVGSLDGFDKPVDVFVQGDYAYLADSEEGLKIVDITDPTNLNSSNVVGVLDFEGASNPVNLVYVDGNDAYIAKAGGNKKLFRVDVSDPTLPVSVLEIGDSPFGTTDMLVSGSDLYAAHEGDGVTILDKETLAIHSNIPVQYPEDDVNGKAAFSVELINNYLLIGEQRAFKVYDVTDKTDPVLKLSYPKDGEELLSTDNVRALVVDDKNAYISDFGKGIKYFEILKEEQVEKIVEVAVEGEDVKGVKGQWKVTNGYKTVEFIPSEKCGINSCGDDIYCLYVPCPDYDKECTANYGVVVRTAQLTDETGSSFVAQPFSGVLDMADNALDYHNEVIDIETNSSIPGEHDFSIYEHFVNDLLEWRHKPPIFGLSKDIASTEKFPDNFWWHFTVKNVIDMTAPHIQTINPGIDMEDVDGYAPVDILFNKEMIIDSLYDIQLKEHPGDALSGNDYFHSAIDSDMVIGEGEDFDPQKLSTATTLTVNHPVRPFGPNDEDFYYFGMVPGSVLADNFNCMYPGRGPYSGTTKSTGVSPKCVVKYDSDGKVQENGVGSLCVPVNKMADTDTGCVTTLSEAVISPTQPQSEICLNKLKDGQVSPIILLGNE